MINESVLDKPKSTLDPRVWQDNPEDGKPILTEEASLKLQKAIEWVQDQYSFNNLSVYLIGSICSNSYSEDSDIDIDFCATGATEDDNDEDVVKEFGWAFKKNFIENYLEKFPEDSKIGSHPFEVYFNPNPFQCFMSVGCYNILEQKWEVGPELKKDGFDPVSEYYEDAMKQVDHILKDIRNQMFGIYELAFSIKKSDDLAWKGEMFDEMLERLAKVSDLYRTMKRVRSNFQKPCKSKEEALKRRKDKKQIIVDAAFKFLDKFGYINIMKDMVTAYDDLNDGAKLQKSEVIDLILASIKENMSLKHLQDSEATDFIAKLEEAENLDEGLLKTLSIASLLAIPFIMPANAVAAMIKKLPRSEIRMTSKPLQQGLADLNTMRLGNFSMTNAINILAWTLYGEAGNQEKVGKKAVASVILNRAGAEPEKMVEVVFNPNQFSMWKQSDKFCKAHNLKTATSDADYTYKVPKKTATINSERISWNDSVEIATQLALGKFKSTIGNRNSYLNIELTKKTNPESSALGPDGWATKMTKKIKIKDHTFGYLPENDGYLLNKIPQGDPNATTYQIKKGDNLWTIARMFKTSVRYLARLNNISVKTPLKIGQTLKLKPTAEITSTTASTPSSTPSYVTVRSGDTLGKIARNNKTTVDKILELNQTIKNPDIINVGQKIRVA